MDKGSIGRMHVSLVSDDSEKDGASLARGTKRPLETGTAAGAAVEGEKSKNDLSGDLATARARFLATARARFLERVIIGMLVARNEPGHLTRTACARHETRCAPLGFFFQTSAVIHVDGSYRIKLAVEFELDASPGCVDESHEDAFDASARRRHDTRLVSNCLDDASMDTDDCGCTWRLNISNSSFDLDATQKFPTLRAATEAAVAAIPLVRMCDECGKLRCHGQYVDPAMLWTLPNDAADRGEQTRDNNVVLCEKCTGSVAFSVPANCSSTTIARDDDDDVCGICHSATRVGFRTPCNHVFHKKCVRLHRKFGSSMDCPVCRRDDALF